MMYRLDTMSDDEVNLVIHTEILGHRDGEHCYGPITVLVTAPASLGCCAWNCTTCSARGEYALNAASPVLVHASQPPNCLHSSRFVSDILSAIVLRKSSEFQRAFDFHMFGAAYSQGDETYTFVGKRSLISRFVGALEPETVCYAAIHALNMLEQAEEVQEQKGDDDAVPAISETPAL